jgi:hypothetical protein
MFLVSQHISGQALGIFEGGPDDMDPSKLAKEALPVHIVASKHVSQPPKRYPKLAVQKQGLLHISTVADPIGQDKTRHDVVNRARAVLIPHSDPPCFDCGHLHRCALKTVQLITVLDLLWKKFRAARNEAVQHGSETFGLLDHCVIELWTNGQANPFGCFCRFCLNDVTLTLRHTWLIFDSTFSANRASFRSTNAIR